MRLRVCVVLLVLMGALWPSGARGSAAPILRVKPGGSGDCSSWPNACDLQTALSSPGGNKEIWVAAGTYTPTVPAGRVATFQLADGVALYGGFAGTETQRSQRDWTAHLTVLSGDLDGNDTTDIHGVVTSTAHIVGANALHVVTGSGVTRTAVLDGFVVTAGKADQPPYDQSGGGIVDAAGSPTIRNATFIGNWAASGGGMLNDGDSAPLLSNVTFSANDVPQSGGAITNLGASPTLIDVTFHRNSAGGYGGAMESETTSSRPLLVNVVFSENSGHEGGGMSNLGAVPTLVNVTFRGNSATAEGGGLDTMCESGDTQALVNVTFTGNSANDGGGLSTSGSCVKLVNVTFSGNAASNHGGGIMHGWGSLGLANSVLWGNTAVVSGTQIFHHESAGVIAHSLIEGSGGSGSGWDGGLGTDGGGNVDADPRFIRDPDPGDGDWTTLDDNDYGDLRLQTSSPAIDAGDNAQVPADVADLDGDLDTAEPTPMDLGGRRRFIDVPAATNMGAGTPPLVDMGAYETRAPAYLPLVQRAAASR